MRPISRLLSAVLLSICFCVSGLLLACSNAPSSVDGVGASELSSADAEADGAEGGDEVDLSPYAEILSQYKDAIASNSEYVGGDAVNSAILHAVYEQRGVRPVYALVDLAEDGVPELVIAVKYDAAGNGDGTSGSVATYRIYDLVGLEGGKAARLRMTAVGDISGENVVESEGFGRERACYLCSDGLVHLGPLDITRTDEEYWRLPADSCEFQLEESVTGGSVLAYQDASGETTVIDSAQAALVYESHVPDESVGWHYISTFAGDMDDNDSSLLDDEEAIITPAYTVAIPEEWRNDYTCFFEAEAPESIDMRLGVAWHCKVYLGPDYAFEVIAISDDWGMQGMFDYINLGPSSSYPGWNVFVFTTPYLSKPEPYQDWVKPSNKALRADSTMEAANSGGDYVLADSAERVYSTAELEAIDLHTLFLARNEIYARHGRIFQSEELRDHFSSKSWYHGTVQPSDFTDSMLNDTERANANAMLDIEKSRNSPYLS